MSTIGLSNWAVDLKTVGAIYPFQGFEVAMVVAGVAFWILWHIWQLRFEAADLKRKSAAITSDRAKAAIERY